MQTTFEANAPWLVFSVLCAFSMHAWLVRSLAPTPSWRRAALAAALIEGAAVFTAVLFQSALGQLACAIPSCAAIFLVIYQAWLGDTFTVSGAFSMAALCVVLRALVTMGSIYLFAMLGAELCVPLLLAVVALVWLVRHWNARRARSLAARMQAAGEVDGIAPSAQVGRKPADESLLSGEDGPRGVDGIALVRSSHSGPSTGHS